MILRGLGDRSVVRSRPSPGSPAIGFAHGLHRGGLESLVLLGDEVSPRVHNVLPGKIASKRLEPYRTPRGAPAE